MSELYTVNGASPLVRSEVLVWSREMKITLIRSLESRHQTKQGREKQIL